LSRNLKNRIDREYRRTVVVHSRLSELEVTACFKIFRASLALLVVFLIVNSIFRYITAEDEGDAPLSDKKEDVGRSTSQSAVSLPVAQSAKPISMRNDVKNVSPTVPSVVAPSNREFCPAEVYSDCIASKVLQNLSVFVPHTEGTPMTLLDVATTYYTIPMARKLPKVGTVFTTTLESDDANTQRNLPSNVVTLSYLTPHKLFSLAATLNFYNVMLLIRLPDVLRVPHFSDVDVHKLLGHLLPLAKSTYLLLPCGYGIETVKESIRRALQANYTVGVKRLQYSVTPLQAYAQLEGKDGKRCIQPLLNITIKAMIRGTRQTWCVHELHEFMGKTLYDHKLKYDFKYLAASDGRPPVYQIGLLKGERFVIAKDLSGEWIPSMKLKDILGWGVSKMQRQLFLAEQLRVPQFPDAGAHNWVVCCGAQAQRIDSTDRAGARSFPKAKYLSLLKSEVCLPHENFSDIDKCLECRACLAHKFTWVKTKTPPQECIQCPDCVQEAFRQNTLLRLMTAETEPDCNVDSDMQYVLPGEDKCYVF
jgi:hypothetical protein